MGNWRINAIDTEKSQSGLHEHISEVHASNEDSATDGFWIRRVTVVADIRTGSDTYYTYANGYSPLVEVVECPRCTFKDYLRSKADATTADNLLALPRKKKAA